ncbi:IQ motif-containing protein H-like [Frieseomelitta varia]|uniref:IQ motif-containing protein H-like n=1 Tax=Frieseomelitta varia TaxID=561572 RepID=UPI001CB6A498|nr:IQ motif-containing protein H-like [Frieseomelitta varia]
MNRHHKLLQTEELYSESIDMIKSAIRELQGQIKPIQKFIGDRKRDITRLSRMEKTDDSNSLESTRLFYEYILEELINIERTCEECFVRLNIDLLTATKDRTQPPFYLSPEEIRKSFRTYCDVFDEAEQESCRCFWENKLEWDLDDTQDILAKPRVIGRTEFDEHDLNFIQEILCLRSRMFSLPRKRTNFKSGHDIIHDTANGKYRASIRLSLETKDFLQLLKHREASRVFSHTDELLKLKSLKFIDGKFKTNDTWMKILDVHGNLNESRWHLVLCPQIEKILTRRAVPLLRLNPRATFNFLSRITNFASFTLSRADIIPLLKYKNDDTWLTSWKFQFKMIDGKNIAATVIQAFWRGYWLRKKKWHSNRLYIAASLMWFFWLSVRARKEMHRRYLKKMLVSLQATRDLALKLSNEYDSIIEQPHVILHLPSLGLPPELRRVFNPKMFAIYQNITIFRICSVRNPKAEVVYILPVKPTQDLLLMYSDFIESISPDEDVAKRITFIALSQADTFNKLSLNVSRILHCSQESLTEIEKKIAGKSAYFVPYFVDECDMRLAGSFNIPLLSTDMEVQKKFVNASDISEMIDNLGLLQPPHKKNITDYETLCTSLSELLVLHTEISMWLIKLNYGTARKHSAIFLINHISMPFMPMLRREREKHGDYWMEQPSLREEFLQKVKDHLPKVIPNVIRVSKMYNTWEMFYTHMQKFGCLLQAIPAEKNPKTIMVSLFVPGKATKKKPIWLGTVDKINLEAAYSTTIYMLPQTSLDITKIQPTVNKFARKIQDAGFFGYLSIECYCYLHEQEEKLVVLLLNIFPYYSYAQSYIDWMKFAIGGDYDVESDHFIADISIDPRLERRRSSFLFIERTPEWNETVKRYAVTITQLHHSKFPTYRWPDLKNLFEECDIEYDRKKRQGSSIILHDGEIRNFGKMVAVSSAMITTLKMVRDNLTKLHETLLKRSRVKSETNLPTLIDFFSKLSLDYKNVATDKCLSTS